MDVVGSRDSVLGLEEARWDALYSTATSDDQPAHVLRRWQVFWFSLLVFFHVMLL